MNRRAIALALPGVLMTPFGPAWAQAPAYPSKPVRVVVALGPGGSGDLLTRVFARRLTEAFGQQFLVENRPGGGSVPGYTYVAKSKPDGYTLLATGLTFTSSFALREGAAVDPVKDYAPVSLLNRAPWLLVVNPSVPAKSVRELVALARARPGTLNFAGGAPGAGTHLLSIWFFKAAKINAVYVPYSTGGTAQSTLDVVAGRGDASIATYGTVKPFMGNGKLRALGISSSQRSKVLPDLVPIAQQGVPGYEAYTFNGWLGPAGTPASVVNRLSEELAKVARSAEMQEKIIDEAGEPVGSTPAQFETFIIGEVARWRTLAKEAGIRLEQ
jgi:tripartite-type tricarboxylate transporter receptor subunit TctC